MRRLLGVIALLAIAALPFFVTSRVAAVDIFNNCSSGATVNQAGGCSDCNTKATSTTVCKEIAAQNADGSNPVIKVIKIIINVVSFVAGVAAVIGLAVSALRMILASGDSNAITSARSGMIYSLVGIAIVVFAQVIVRYVLKAVN
ncbi:MAG: hypothetical protein ABIV43_03400 [Candidatus Saccharimonadales bacterium]